MGPSPSYFRVWFIQTLFIAAWAVAPTPRTPSRNIKCPLLFHFTDKLHLVQTHTYKHANLVKLIYLFILLLCLTTVWRGSRRKRASAADRPSYIRNGKWSHQRFLRLQNLFSALLCLFVCLVFFVCLYVLILLFCSLTLVSWSTWFVYDPMREALNLFLIISRSCPHRYLGHRDDNDWQWHFYYSVFVFVLFDFFPREFCSNQWALTLSLQKICSAVFSRF